MQGGLSSHHHHQNHGPLGEGRQSGDVQFGISFILNRCLSSSVVILKSLLPSNKSCHANIICSPLTKTYGGPKKSLGSDSVAGARLCLHFTHTVSHLTLPHSSRRQILLSPPILTGGKTKAHRGETSCLKSHSSALAI